MIFSGYHPLNNKWYYPAEAGKCIGKKTLFSFFAYSSIAQSVEHSAVNRSVVGSSPTRGAGNVVDFQSAIIYNRPYGSMVKRLRHRPFTAVTGVRFPLESFFHCADVAQLAEQLTCNQQVIGSGPIVGFWTISSVG